MKVQFTKLTAQAASLLLYLWQLPQNICGTLLVAFLPSMIPIDFKGPNNRFLPSSLIFLSDAVKGGVSLGRYVVVNTATGYNTWAHERGHSIQSMILGPLYLLVIGLPSLIWAAWWNDSRGVSYSSFYTERWADKLGDVKR